MPLPLTAIKGGIVFS